MDLVDVVEVVSAVLRQLKAPYGNHKKKEESPYGELYFIRKEIIRAEKIIKDLGENKNFYTYDEPEVLKNLLDLVILVYNMEDFAETFTLSRRLHLIRRYIFILRQMLNLKAKRDFGSALKKIDVVIEPLMSVRRQSDPREESFVVGLEEEQTKMVTWLTDNNSRPNLGLILISGKTGSGKTTLAKEIYKRCKIERHFESCEWVSASDDPVSNLRSILQKISGLKTVDLECRTVTELEEKICEILKNKRCLVVVDNVQSPYLLKTRPGSALSEEGNGSRVIMTMRSKYDVGQMKRSENKDKFDVEQSLTGQEKQWLLVVDKDKAKINYRFKARSGSALSDEEGNGSKVIMTVIRSHVEHSLTHQQRDLVESQPRNEDESSYSASECLIKLFMDGYSSLCYPYELHPLQDEDAWCLFKKKVKRHKLHPLPDEDACLFKKKVRLPDNNVHSSDLEKLKSKIIAICQGIPSAIVVLGRFLLTKNCGQWLAILDQHLIEGNEDSVSRLSTILALMNSDLTFGLRPCLFYFVLFKRGCEIPVRRLLLLWVAEGLIVTDHPNPEETAERILTYFIIKGIIEIVQLRKDGDPKTCRMPGIVYDICLSKAEDILGLLHINETSKNDKSTVVSRKFGVRRVAEHSDIKYYSCKDHSHMQHLRSYLSFNARNEDTPVVEIGDFLSKVIGHRGFGLLRVLDLERVYKPKLPENLGKLYQLRYLGLRWTFLDTLPHSVSKLSCLQTLDVKHTYISSLPNSIWKMEHLRHLWLNEIRLDVKKHSISLPDPGLQTLWGLFVDNKTPVKNGLDKLKKLKKLGLTFHLASLDELNEWIKSLEGLQSLRLRSKKENGRPSKLKKLESLSGLENLTNLYLLGKLPKLNDRYFPKSLAVLTLSVSKLKEDPMPTLAKLPKLSVLGLLADSYTGKEMVCHRGGFPKLRILKLWMLNELETWTVNEGAMPDLNELEIRCCHNLKELPDKLLNLSSIDKIILTNMQKEFEDKVEEKVKDKVHKVTLQDDVEQET